MVVTSWGSSGITEALLRRVCGEFLEMPGLRLTRQQAKRLWGLDDATCREILDFLVDAKFLARPERDGAYSRLTDGSALPPRLVSCQAPHEAVCSRRLKESA